jgi:predicted GNAT family acetyltransferase
VLTELGLDFVARQVEPWPKDRAELKAVAGTDQIPVLQVENGSFFRGAREIFGHLRERERSKDAAAHRRRFEAHRPARESDVPGQLLAFFDGTDELEAADGPVSSAEVVNVPEAGRYELRVGGRLIGVAAYRRRNGRIAFTHTEVDQACEGRGFGSRLAEVALADAAKEKLEVVPLCPFIAQYIEKHPEYRPLVAE